MKSIIGIGILALATLAGAAGGISNYQDIKYPKSAYTFLAWPKGAQEPVRFKSGLYVKDGFSQVRIDEGRLFPSQDDTPVRTPADFDSLRMYSLGPVRSVSTPQGVAYFRDTLWHPAFVVGNFWVFKKVSGRISLYTTEPGRGAYRGMDTGTGLSLYEEAAVRRKLGENPRAAKLLREEKIGHNASWIMGATGLGLLAAGAATSFVAEEGPGGPLMLAGVGIAAFAWLPHIVVQDRFEAALKAYNEDAAK